MLHKLHQLATARNVIILLALDFIMMGVVMPQVSKKCNRMLLMLSRLT